MDMLIRKAIAEKSIVEFRYQGYVRIGEPHIYGLHQGNRQLLIYQLRGGSNSGNLPNWRRVDLGQVTGFTILNERFQGPRENPFSSHDSWDQIFAHVR